MTDDKSKKKKKKKKKTYTPAPDIPEDAQERFQTMLMVLSGEMTVTQGAKILGLSRNHFQTLMHRSLEGMLGELSPKAPGRPKRPDKEVKLDEENQRLRKQVARLEGKMQQADRQLDVMTEILRERVTGQRAPRTSKKAKTTMSSDETDGDQRVRLMLAKLLLDEGLCKCRAARGVGIRAPTLRRWLVKDCGHEPLVGRPGPKQPPPPTSERTTKAAALVKGLKGQIGAAALGKSTGVSRRRALSIKRHTLTKMERDRKQACTSVEVTIPGVLRGFDGMAVPTTEGRRHLLFASDAAIPYRTSVWTTKHQDAEAIRAALEHDMARHGPPLAYRVDRARAHRAKEVKDLLEANGVLMTHGPPRYPQYYGQTENQNREHRGWLRQVGPLTPGQLEEEAASMLQALNELKPRRKLQWRTSAQLWRARQPLIEDRRALVEEVKERAAKLMEEETEQMNQDLAMRFAIEATLIKRGYLRIETGVGAR